MAVQTSNPTSIDVRDHTFALAIAVLRERISQLPKADQDDLYELLPAILKGDEEERESACAAVNEILNATPATVRPLNLSNEDNSGIEKWLTYFSRQLKEARKEAALTQEQLAEKSGIPQAHISRLENQQHSPSAKTIEKLAQALGKPASYFDPCTEG